MPGRGCIPFAAASLRSSTLEPAISSCFRFFFPLSSLTSSRAGSYMKSRHSWQYRQPFRDSTEKACFLSCQCRSLPSWVEMLGH